MTTPIPNAANGDVGVSVPLVRTLRDNPPVVVKAIPIAGIAAPSVAAGRAAGSIPLSSLSRSCRVTALQNVQTTKFRNRNGATIAGRNVVTTGGIMVGSAMTANAMVLVATTL